MSIVTLINDALLRDGGKKYKEELYKALHDIKDAYTHSDKPRTYLGASQIVHPCLRKVWYDFRQVYPFTHPEPRLIRLFNRGHLEEARLTALLRAAGFPVQTLTAEGKQLGFAKGFYRGSADGITPITIGKNEHDALVEYKTHNTKSFGNLQAKGLKSAKPEHFKQMQVLMYELNVPFTIYLAVNKNDDELYGEFVQVATEIGEEMAEIAEELILSNVPPKKLADNASYYNPVSGIGCKYCNYKELCHYNDYKQVQQVCGTCVYCKFTAIDKVECLEYSALLQVSPNYCKKYVCKEEL